MDGLEFTGSPGKISVPSGLVQRYKKVANVARNESRRAVTAIP
jgi:hypothetical protein